MQSSSQSANGKAALHVDLEKEIEAEAHAAAEAVRARRRVDLLLAQLSTPLPSGATPPSTDVTRAEYARRSRVSEATVSRWLKEGMPSIPVGSTVRIEPAAAHAWRQSRGRVPTRATAKAPGDIEVEDVLSSAGLRLVANGGRR